MQALEILSGWNAYHCSCTGNRGSLLNIAGIIGPWPCKTIWMNNIIIFDFQMRIYVSLPYMTSYVSQYILYLLSFVCLVSFDYDKMNHMQHWIKVKQPNVTFFSFQNFPTQLYYISSFIFSFFTFTIISMLYLSLLTLKIYKVKQKLVDMVVT